MYSDQPAKGVIKCQMKQMITYLEYGSLQTIVQTSSLTTILWGVSCTDVQVGMLFSVGWTCCESHRLVLEWWSISEFHWEMSIRKGACMELSMRRRWFFWSATIWSCWRSCVCYSCFFRSKNLSSSKVWWKTECSICSAISVAPAVSWILRACSAPTHRFTAVVSGL